MLIIVCSEYCGYCLCLCGLILKLNYVGAKYAWLVMCEAMTLYFCANYKFFGLNENSMVTCLMLNFNKSV